MKYAAKEGRRCTGDRVGTAAAISWVLPMQASTPPLPPVRITRLGAVRFAVIDRKDGPYERLQL